MKGSHEAPAVLLRLILIVRRTGILLMLARHSSATARQLQCAHAITKYDASRQPGGIDPA
ncbi:hypothetical protein [Burkholderia gladioli]|uniref:hypothetical protein n=1 Tax=Burkholderia gladioli TaxID=28095 RepID=UPI00163FEB38|nr:hypothetical protein [Burkholderia gladioli]